mmetsp:Transcript_17271/g.53954  ORF Transcript_17271/g.53954 Transcript_17271/m.53954 type:complete len:330 (-) Transcript_17271:774-1763(-)
MGCAAAVPAASNAVRDVPAASAVGSGGATRVGCASAAADAASDGAISAGVAARGRQVAVDGPDTERVERGIRGVAVRRVREAVQGEADAGPDDGDERGVLFPGVRVARGRGERADDVLGEDDARLVAAVLAALGRRSRAVAASAAAGGERPRRVHLRRGPGLRRHGGAAARSVRDQVPVGALDQVGDGPGERDVQGVRLRQVRRRRRARPGRGGDERPLHRGPADPVHGRDGPRGPARPAGREALHVGRPLAHLERPEGDRGGREHLRLRRGPRRVGHARHAPPPFRSSGRHRLHPHPARPRLWLRRLRPPQERRGRHLDPPGPAHQRL